VIYTVMSDEQRHRRLKRAASFRVAAKTATGFVERLDCILDTPFAFLVTAGSKLIIPMSRATGKIAVRARLSK